MPATIEYISLHLNMYNGNMTRKGGVHRISDFLTKLHLILIISYYNDTIREVSDISETNKSKIRTKTNGYFSNSHLKKNFLFLPLSGIVGSKTYLSLQLLSRYLLHATSVTYFFLLNWYLSPLGCDMKHRHITIKVQL